MSSNRYNSTLIADAASKFTDGEFCLGDTSKGWDCLNSLLAFYRRMGFEFPGEFEGVTEENYIKIWKEDNERARDLFERFLLSLGDDVSPNFSIRGDLLVFRGRALPAFPAINLGQGNMMIVFEDGVHVEPFARFARYLLAVRRLIK